MAEGFFEILKDKVKDARFDIHVEEVGFVEEVGDGVAKVSGLSGARYNELVYFDSTNHGIVFSLKKESVDVVIVGNPGGVKAGDSVRLTGKVLSIPVSEKVLGRIINPMGRPLDGLGEIKTSDMMALDRDAPSLIERDFVREPLYTGVKVIDSMLPIGRGQRELIIGDSGTGKTAIAIDTIVNQKDSGVKCVYVAVGKRKAEVARVVEELKGHGAMDHTVVVVADADSSLGLKYIAPYAGASVAEYFMLRGEDVLIVYDDLTRHADTYRSLSLLLRRPPGREAFPGDIFYIHSSLLERAARRHDRYGGGSITALPIVETYAGRITAYIPTNLISITDGQIYLDLSLFNSGILPAVDIGKSVSRIGGKTQQPAMIKVSERLKLDYAQFLEVEIFTKFGARIEEETRSLITRGERLREVLKQPRLSPLGMPEQVITFFILSEGYLDTVGVSRVRGYVSRLLLSIHEKSPEIIEEIETTGQLTSKREDELRTIVSEKLKEIVT
jgi:F-type H+-transporting ATPase subunit alpha